MFEERLVNEYFERIRNRKQRYIERELQIDIDTDKVISIIGPRRAGKTSLLLNWFFQDPDRSVYIDLESIEFSRVTPEEILKIIALYEARYGGTIERVFLDEIQVLDRWHSLVRGLLNRGYRVIISGSSSKLLPKELSTSLRGRTLSYLLLPFSYKEFLRAKGVVIRDHLTLTEKEKMKQLLTEYLMYGGYPEVVFSKMKDKILKEYFETIFLKDFVERHAIKSINTARVIFEYLFQNYSKEVSIEKIHNFIKDQIGITTKTTIYSYMDKISDTLSVFFVERYSKSVYKRKRWPKKVYVCDVGVSSLLSFSEDLGKRMENTVFLELLRSQNEKPMREVYFWKDVNHREVDFVIKEKGKVIELIQVTYASNREGLDDREARALIKASTQLECDKLTVITWDYEGEEHIKGKVIRYVPLWRWLSSAKYLY